MCTPVEAFNTLRLTPPVVPATRESYRTALHCTGCVTLPGRPDHRVETEETNGIGYMNQRIRVLLVDDHLLVRQGIRTLLSEEGSIQIVGEAGDGVEAILKARHCRPDVILMDLHMPRKSGIEATREILQTDPESRVLILTGFADDEDVVAAIRAGAVGYLLKDTPATELCQAIAGVYSGRSSLDPGVATTLIREFCRPPDAPDETPHLTARERDVLLEVSQGSSNQEIANRLRIGERTVRTHISNLMSKLHLHNRTQVATYAVRHGLLNEQASP